MKSLRIAALAALMAVAGGSVAMADWTGIGSLDLNGDFSRARLDGPSSAVSGLELRARGNGVECRNVRVFFDDGSDASLFNGRLYQHQPQRVDLPGRFRHIRGIAFECRSVGGPARLEVAANTRWDNGGDRGPGYGGPNYGGSGGDGPGYGGPGYGGPGYGGPGYGGPGNGGGVIRPENWNRWQQASTANFDRRSDRASTPPDWSADRVETVALRPRDNDARCDRVVALYGNGQRQALAVNRYDVLRRGLFYVLDIPGDNRTVREISLRCRALGDRDVQIEIWVKQRH